MKQMTLPCPAKLNLFLHVTGQLPNGYHTLQTLFTFLDYSDTLTLRSTDTPAITLEAPIALGKTEDNLIYRAAKLLQATTGCQKGAQLSVHKQIPAGAGLGGGSSNAATTLLGLNQLWNTCLSTKELKALALKLGADVPVFIHGQTAFAEGVGEVLTSTNIEQKHYIIVVPDAFVSTQAIFQHPHLTRNSPIIKLAPLLQGDQHQSLRNDCQAVVTECYPVIQEALDWLAKRFGTSQMSGTGSAVFAPVASLEKGARMLAQLPHSWSGFVATSCNTSPLYDALQQQQSDKG